MFGTEESVAGSWAIASAHQVLSIIKRNDNDEGCAYAARAVAHRRRADVDRHTGAL